MGICKCRVVTSLFCFQHRINVCEDCLVREHPTCIIRTYLQWLQDNDFDPACKLCREPLNNGEPTVRLLCHDVFHGRCLNNYVSTSFPSDTAPAGYTCPACAGKTVVPPDNAGGPVATALKQFLSTAPWASLHSASRAPAEQPPSQARSIPALSAAGSDAAPAATVIDIPAPAPTAPAAPRMPVRVPAAAGHSDGIVSRKGTAGPGANAPEDEDKYARRPANAWFAQLVGNNRMPAHKPVDPNSGLKRAAVMLLLLVFGVITLIEVLTRARPAGDNDPLLDPALNPHVRTD
eukprot:m.24139 g.24139  ORF g.24139 m.24139 type:complete len:291 (-) comp3978_c0_seq1:166-1038(-)